MVGARESGRNETNLTGVSFSLPLPLFLLIFFSLSFFASHSTIRTPETGCLHGGDDGKNARLLSPSLQNLLILKASAEEREKKTVKKGM